MEKNNNDSREKLLLAAERLFAQKGYAGVSIRELAAVAGVNSSMISYYFQGKKGLYQAVLQSKMELMRGMMDQKILRNLSPEDVFKRYIQTICCVHKEYPYFIKLINQELTNPTDILLDFLPGYLQIILASLRDALYRGISEGHFRKNLDVNKSIMMFAGAVNFYFVGKPIHSNVMEQDENFADGYMENTLQIFLRGIRREGNNG